MQQPSAVKSDVTSNSCDKCNEQFPCSFETLEQHQTSGHGTTRQCDSCKELEADEQAAIAFVCFLCGIAFNMYMEVKVILMPMSKCRRTCKVYSLWISDLLVYSKSSNSTVGYYIV